MRPDYSCRPFLGTGPRRRAIAVAAAGRIVVRVAGVAEHGDIEARPQARVQLGKHKGQRAMTAATDAPFTFQ